MRNIIVIFAIVLLSPMYLQAQEIVYLSNLGQATSSSNLVGSDSWLASGFDTGANAGGYSLDSIQLAMANANGNPGGFTVMLYSAGGIGGAFPAISLGTLSGPANPSTAGIYTYSPASSLILSPSTSYFIMLTAGTAVANGAYEWSNTGVYPISYAPEDGWSAPIGSTFAYNYRSSNGSSWNISDVIPGAPEFAITAEVVPEPSPSRLLLLGLVYLFTHQTMDKHSGCRKHQ
jgi:hypothetical protein